MDDGIEESIRAAAVKTLRLRADRQRKIAVDWTVTGARGVRVMSGEARIAERLAEVLDRTAAEIEAEARHG